MSNLWATRATSFGGALTLLPSNLVSKEAKGAKWLGRPPAQLTSHLEVRCSVRSYPLLWVLDDIYSKLSHVG